MDRYRETFNTWNKIAALYQDKFMDLDLYNESYDFFCKAIPKKNATILDLGCGPGNISRYLLSQRPDFQLTGIDIAPNMIALAKLNNPMATFIEMDSRQINTLATSFDGIICGFCLPYLSSSDCSKLIADAALLLANNGILYLSFVEGDGDQSGFQVGSDGDRVYFYYHPLEHLKQVLIDNHFAALKIFEVAYPKGKDTMEIHHILIYRKKAAAKRLKTFGSL